LAALVICRSSLALSSACPKPLPALAENTSPAVAPYRAIHHNSVTPRISCKKVAWRHAMYMLKYNERNG
jgi:hypothetical protein